MKNFQDNLRVGVIGVGNMGFHHARVLSQLEAVKLCAVADFDALRAQSVAARFNAIPYSNFIAMLESEKLDAVTIAVPTRAHLEVARQVIEHGVHLLVEKPLASNPQDAQEIVNAARHANVQLAVGHVERFNPAVQALRAQIQNGSLGKISSVVAKRVGVMPPQVKDANVIIDLAVHDIDVLNYFFETMPRVVNATAGHALLANRYDHAEIFLRYRDAGCFIQVNWITPIKIRTLSVTGDAGHAELNYVTQNLEIFESTVAREYDDFGDFVVRFGEAHRSVLELEKREPLQLELQDFVSAIVENRPPSVSGTQGVQVLEIADQALRAVHAP